MGKFSQRSNSLELMDLPIEDKAAIAQNFKELVTINKYLGGANHSHWAIHRVCGDALDYSLCDIGSGAGDFLNYLYSEDGAMPELHAVDPMPEAMHFAKLHYGHIASIRWHQMGYKAWFADARQCDFVHAALFCHHLEREALVEFVQYAVKHARKAVIINDLHRHPLAYYSIKLLCTLFSKSVYTKNDAPLSVLRGFTAKEWHAILNAAGITTYELHWKWAFRHVIIIPAQ